MDKRKRKKKTFNQWIEIQDNKQNILKSDLIIHINIVVYYQFIVLVMANFIRVLTLKSYTHIISDRYLKKSKKEKTCRNLSNQNIQPELLKKQVLLHKLKTYKNIYAFITYIIRLKFMYSMTCFFLL